MSAAIGALPDESASRMTADGIRLREILGQRPGAAADPDAFLNQPHVQYTERPPGHVTHPHFHVVDQFQFYLGTATLGKTAVRPGMIQYTRAHTPYGPIVAGDNGLVYLVLRAKGDPGAKYMPASRPLLRRVRPRNEIFEISLDGREDEGSGPREGGLEVARRIVGANAAVDFAAPEASDGQFGIVLSGTVTRAGASYPRWSCAFVGAGERDGALRAGPEGVDLLILRFPVPLPEEAAT